jgi:anti-sigma factor RsiW
MTSEPREELISAYLDGELSAAERAEVEKWLSESAELRQIHDELRSLRSSMLSLPRHKLDQDLGPGVLRRAERAVLGGQSLRPATGKVGPGPIHRWWSRGTWRRWAWPAVAVAAALALLVHDAQRRPAEREVAKAPQDGAVIAAARDEGTKEKGDLPASMSALREDNAEHPAPAAAAPKARLAKPLAGGNKNIELRASAPPVPEEAEAEQEDHVAVEVSGEFIRERTFEKLLTTNKLVWQRAQDADPSEQDPRAKSPPLQTRRIVTTPQEPVSKDDSPAPTGPRVDYFVEATPEQVDEIVVELRNDARGVRQVAGDGARAQNAKVPNDAKQQQQQRRFLFTLQTTAQPAAPSGAEKKP